MDACAALDEPDDPPKKRQPRPEDDGDADEADGGCRPAVDATVSPRMRAESATTMSGAA